MAEKFVFIIFVLAMVVCLSSCGNNQYSLEETEVPLSMEALSALEPVDDVTQATPHVTNQVVGTPGAQTNLGPSSPGELYKPTHKEIQVALNNAGYYKGAIDGKIGPMTKKAVREFQEANGLKVDGKVGFQTWGVLSAYLDLLVESQKEEADH